ncbi:MAG: hypothetical protein ACM30E_06715 [Nitrososphaerales archaeon]
MPALLPIVPPSRRAADLILRVEEATTGSRRGEFLAVAHRLYRGDRRWIPPFKSARRDALRPERNPLLDNADIGAFLGVAQNLGLGDEAVGSLAAWPGPGDFDEDSAAWGYWGLFEAMNVEELADRLFYEAENWIFEHTPGIVGIRGPWSLEPLVAPGLLTDGFDALPTAFLPYNLPYYPEMIEAQGYEPAMTWRIYSLDLPSSSRREQPPPVTAGGWQGIARLYSAQDEAQGGGADLVPGLVGWLNHLSGEANFAFSRSWRSAVGRAFSRALAVLQAEGEEAGAACFGVPDIGGGLRLSRGRQFPLGWLLFEIGLRRTRRLRVFPAALPGVWRAGQLAELYAALAGAAAGAGYRQLHVAPVPDDDERGQAAMAILGAQPAQQFTVYEKGL